MSRDDGFSLTELMVASTVMLLVIGGALTTFQNALRINDTGSQLADANQNLRAGTNTLVRDLLMAGRIIGAEGISLPTPATYKRPGPINLNFDLVSDGDSTMQMPSISTGYQLGPLIKGQRTDIVTIMTVDEFMPTVTTPPATATASTSEATLSADGTYITFGTTSQWLDGDTAADTPKIKIGDLVLYVGNNGKAIQTVTSIDLTSRRINFSSTDAVNDFFRFNQPNATTGTGMPLAWMKDPAGAALAGNAPWQVNVPTAVPPTYSTTPVTLFKALMITYYVDDVTTPGTPRLTRVVNNFPPQVLAGVVEDLDLTYDLYDGVANPTNVTSLPCVGGSAQCPLGSVGVTYTSNQIRKVNIHVGVRSEIMSKPMQDYVRNHILTAVNVRSMAAVDRYPQ